MPHSYQPEQWRELFLVATSCVVRMVRAVLSSWALMFGVEYSNATTTP
jgi:hypothetical protein